MNRHFTFKLARVAMTLLAAAFCVVGNADVRYKAPRAVGNASQRYIDLTFSASGEASNVEDVTVSNLTHTAIPSLTLKGTATLRLNNLDATSDEGDVNGDGKVDIADIATIISVMASGSADVSSASADVNGDGKISNADVSYIISLIAGKSRIAPDVLLMRAGTPALPEADVVTMDFHAGDILRFEGKSGEMRTIVVNVPKTSHKVPFCFYPCKDADGNTYPIVEAGGLLWMAEDLKCKTGIAPYFQNQPARWADAARQGYINMAMINSSDENDVYYTYSAARKALPEGWSLPTLGELDAVVKKLGGYDVVGDKMQRAGDRSYLSFPSKMFGLPDSLQLRIQPMGYVGEDGNVTDFSSGFIMTDTRENGEPICMRITDGFTEGFITQVVNGKEVPLTLKKYAAVHVRGVRPAPSAYTDMMVALCCDKAVEARANAPFKAEGNAEGYPWTGANPYTGTPYGEYYNVDYSTKQIVLDVAGQNSECFSYLSQCQLDKAYYGTNFVDANNGSLTQKKPDPEWITNANGNRLNRTYLKKLRPQKVADGTFNTLKLSFDVPVRSHANDGSANPAWMARDLENRDGHLILEVFGNKESDFATLATITLPETYKMAAFDGAYSEASQNTYVNEFFLKRLNLLTADFNNDGVDDVVVGFCGKWTVLDGKDYTTVLAQRTFDTDCVRACVDDLDANGIPDFGIIYQQNNQIFVYVLLNDINKFDQTKYPKLNVDGCRDYYAILPPVSNTGVSSFLDIKFADITNTGNSVLCLMVPNSYYSDWNRQSTFYVLDRTDDTKELQASYTLNEGVAFGLSNMSSDNSNTSSNSTIAVVHTRGMGSVPDVLLRNGLYRLNDKHEFEKVNIGGCKDGGTMIDAIIPSDCVAVGRFSDDLPDGCEQLAYFGNRIAESLSGMGWYHSGSGQSFPMMTSKEQYVYGVTELLTPGTNGAMTRKELHTGVVASLNWCSDVSGSAGIHYSASLPAFCATSYDNIDTRRFKFVSCEATMSEPRIKYMLAAAPYYKDYEYTNGPSTGWSKSSEQSYSEGNSNGTKASLIFGFEQENKISIFGIEIGKYGFEFETEISHEWEKTITDTKTYTYESGCSTHDDDVVGLTMTPVWLYTYECIDSNDPDNIGQKLVCGAPSNPRDLEITLTDYMRLRADNEEIPDLSKVFTHTPGYPFSYINNTNDMESRGREFFWGNNNKNDFASIGSGSDHSLSIQLTNEQSSETTNTFSLEMSLVGFVGAMNNTVKAGFGAGYNHTWSTAYTVSQSTTVTGSVPGPKKLGDVPMFYWNLCRYITEIDGQEFLVVNYVVRH